MKNSKKNYSPLSEISIVKEKETFTIKIIRLFKNAPLTAWFGMIVILTYSFVAVFADFIAPYGEAEIFEISFAPWSDEFIFGTDQLGRDVYTRLIYGARNTVGIAVATTILSFLIGGSFGLIAAINGGNMFGKISFLIIQLIFSPRSLAAST